MKKLLQQGQIMVLLILVGQFFTAFVGRSLSPFMVYIGDDLALTKMQLGLFPTALFIGQFLATMPIGYYSDRVNTRKLILVLMSVVAGSFLVFAWMDNFYLAFFCILVAGLGYGGMHPVTNKLLVYEFPVSKLTLPMGVKQMSITLASAAISILLLPLAMFIGWRWTVTLAVLVLVIVCFISSYFFSRLPWIEKPVQSKEPLWSQVKLLNRSKMLFFTNSSAFILMGVQMTFNTFLILFLVETKDWTIYVAGLCLALSELCGAAGRVLWGVISDRLFAGNRWLVLLGITIISSVSLMGLYLTQSVVLIVIFIAFIGFALSGFNGIWMMLAVESVDRSLSGFASGYSVTVASIGVFLIPPLFGYFIEQGGYGLAGLFMTSLFFLCALLMIYAMRHFKGV
ncbi:MFS transporter [Solibacillus sp. R5-41]|uniref:MFS transporter n=1 Tax=Solibacillus sp. R5-41 TaxID=2048654 RepID=UPI000C126671|nr:MFS transporter [Solibacillus sp. R5-41]ATP41183.1 MFS transporter [Solibacillus sp. R5-41]